MWMRPCAAFFISIIPVGSLYRIVHNSILMLCEQRRWEKRTGSGGVISEMVEKITRSALIWLDVCAKSGSWDL